MNEDLRDLIDALRYYLGGDEGARLTDEQKDELWAWELQLSEAYEDLIQE